MIVGVDIGTQSLKAVAVDRDLRVAGEASVAYAPHYPRPGWAEQEPALWEAALAPAIAGALAAANAAPADVAALGIAGQLDGCVPVDAAGAALGPCLIWCDRRAVDAVAGLPVDALRRSTGLVADASHMAAKIRWLGPDRAARFHQPVSYVVARLTGEHVMDHGHASTTMLYDLAARDYDDRWLAAFGIDRARLPRIAEATDVAGALHAEGAALCGLPAGTLVAVGTGDDFATPLGAGIAAPGAAACVLGTAEVVGAVSAGVAIDAGALVETHAYVGGLYFVENPGWLAGGAIEWLCGVAGFADAAAVDAAANTAPAGAGGVTFVPALSGAMAPEWIATARACLYGLTAAHGREHVARAVLEGCAFAMRDVIDRVRELGVDVGAIRLLGGGARSELWAQIRADVARTPVAVPARVDTCALGAAAIASVAAGRWPTVAAAAARLSAGARSVEPDPARADRYDEAYARYRALFAALRPLFSP